LTRQAVDITWCNNMKIFFYGLIVITLLYFNERMNEIENALMFESSSTVKELIIDHQWEISQLKKRLDNAKLNHGV
jgi:hypothetical protein